MSFKTNNPVVQSLVNSGISAAVGSSVQAYSAKLADIAGLTLSSGKFLTTTGSNIILSDASAVKSTLGLSNVASTGDYNDLSNKPSLFSGSYTDLTNKPSLFSGAYADLTGKPTLGTAAAADLGTAAGNVPVLDGSGKLASAVIPALAITSVSVVADDTARDALTVQEGDIAVVTSTNKTFIYDGSAWVEMKAPTGASVTSVNGFSGTVVLTANDISGISAVGKSGDYADLLNKPTLFSGSYTDLTNQPSLFSGSYTDLTDKPTLFSGAYADLTGAPTLATVATSGLYSDLSGAPTLGTAAALDAGTAVGNVPVLGSDGKLASAVLPALAITSVSVVADNTARDALTVQEGDIAVVTGDNKTYIYNGTSWVEIKTPAAAGSVGSVNGYTGTVVLTASDISGFATVATTGSYTDLTNKPSLATVATSGDYNDLINKPTITGDSSVAKEVLVVTAAGGVTVTTDNHIVIINKTTGAATAVTLPASPATGKMIVVKDGKGDAATNNITISGSHNIDGSSSVVIDQNYETVTVVFNGSQWNVI